MRGTRSALSSFGAGAGKPGQGLGSLSCFGHSRHLLAAGDAPDAAL